MRYAEELAKLILEENYKLFNEINEGLRLKISNLSDETNNELYALIRKKFKEIVDCFILSDKVGESYITISRAVWLRDHNPKPLFLIIPAAEQEKFDSLGDNVFKKIETVKEYGNNLEVKTDSIDIRLLNYLIEQVPTESKLLIKEIINSETIGSCSTYKKIDFLISLFNNGFENPGIYLYIFSLLPDYKIYEEETRVEQRLKLNSLICQHVFDSKYDYLARLENLTKSIRISNIHNIKNSIIGLLNVSSNFNSTEEVCKLILKDDYSSLRFDGFEIDILNNNLNAKINILSFRANGKNTTETTNEDGYKKFVITTHRTPSFSISFEVNPPGILDNIKRYSIKLMAIVEGGNFEEFESEIFTFPPPKNNKKIINYKSFDIENLSGNLFFFRLIAFGENDVILNNDDDFKERKHQIEWEELKIRNDDKADKSSINGQLTCDTEYFLFDESEDVESQPKTKPSKINSVFQASLSTEIKLLKRGGNEVNTNCDTTTWGWVANNDKSNRIFNAKFTLDRTSFKIVIPEIIYKIQRKFIEHPDACLHLEVNIDNEPVLEPKEISESLRKIVRENKLFKLRKELFKNLSLIIPNDETGSFETANLNTLKSDEYTKEYFKLLTEIIKQNDKKLLKEFTLLDTVKVKAKSINGDDIALMLILPFHPLRLNWFLQLRGLLNKAKKKIEENGINKKGVNELLNYEIEQLIVEELTPQHNPQLLIDTGDNYFEYFGELIYGWSAYTIINDSSSDSLPMGSDNREVFQKFRELLGIKNMKDQDPDLDVNIVIKHLSSYLKIHPYVDQLNINLFNAGDGEIFVQALLSLQKDRTFKDLRYEIRFFAKSGSIIDTGSAFKTLTNPETNLSEEASDFTIAARSRLFPKLRYSINTVDEFLKNSVEYDAHITFLVNPFNRVIESIKLPQTLINSNYLDGLCIEPKIVFNQNKENGEYFWSKLLKFPEEAGENFLVKNSKLFGEIFTIFESNSEEKSTKNICSQLKLQNQDIVLIDKMHSCSDWVITFDRNLGPELFDLPPDEVALDSFLIDFIPEPGLRSINSFLTSKPSIEIESIFRRELKKHLDLEIQNFNIKRLINDLRTVSGSILLNLNSSDNRILETIGIAFTKQLFYKKGILENQFMIPIDLHQTLFKKSLIQSRADLLLVAVEDCIVNICVVEIKCRTNRIGDLAWDSLVEKMLTQIENTIDVLTENYSWDSNRINNEIKVREFQNLLLFYAERAARFKVIGKNVSNIIDDIKSLHKKEFSIVFEKRAVVYDFNSNQHISKELYNDLTIYRVGKDAINIILDDNKDIRTQIPITENADIVTDFTFAKSKTNLISSSRIENQIIKKETTGLLSPNETALITDVHALKDNNLFNSSDSIIIGGENSQTEQYGLLGKYKDKKVFVDLNGTNTYSIFGIQGSGKSYTIGLMAEMVLKQFEKINVLPKPLAGIIFHWSDTQDYEPEFTTLNIANSDENEVKKLKDLYGAEPGSIAEVILMVPASKVEERRKSFPGISVFPILFSSSELSIKDWKSLMHATNNEALYISQVSQILETIRNETRTDAEPNGKITLEKVIKKVTSSAVFNNSQRELLLARLTLANQFINDSVCINDYISPGKLIIIDMRDELIDKNEVLNIFIVLLSIFSNAGISNNNNFNKFVVFDEAHKYMSDQKLSQKIVEVVREMRHKGVTIMIASQDPKSLPITIIELSSLVIIHRLNSPEQIKHVKKCISQLDNLDPKLISNLGKGRAYVWANNADNTIFTKNAQLLDFRPKVTQHGGKTKLANS